MPVIGMEPALKPASLLPGDGYVVVMATHMTLTQPKFLRLMERYGQNALPVPCPGLMECVEAGVFSGPRVEGLLGQAPCFRSGNARQGRGAGLHALSLFAGGHFPLLCAGHSAHRRQPRHRAPAAPPSGGGRPPLSRTGRCGFVPLLPGGRGGGGAYAVHAETVAGND